jgi:hypothetical protein
MKKVTFLFLLFAVFIFSCNEGKSKHTLNDLLIRDVPKFIRALPTLSHDSMQLAFDQINKVLNYKNAEMPASQGTLEASSEIKNGMSRSDGQLIVLASPLLPHSNKNEFAISLIAYPPPSNDTLYEIANLFLSTFPRTDKDNLPTWQINGWLLQVKDKNSLVFYAPSNKSIYDLYPKM